MHAHSNKPVGQEWLIKIMQAFGYQHVQEEGQCFGIAAMAMQAFLAGEEDVFNERIDCLYQLSKKLSQQEIITLINNKKMGDVITIDSHEMKMLDIYSFFDGITLYQNPEGYKKDIFLTEPLAIQRKMAALSIVSPIQLDSNAPQRCQTSCGVYDLSQLTTYLTQLKEHLTVRTSLMLNSSNHTINLSFDPQKQQWILFDANHFTAKTFDRHQTNNLAKEIMDAFDAGYKSKNHTIFSTDFFVCQENTERFKKDYSKLQSQENWKKIHYITPQTVTKRDAFDSSLLPIAIRCGDHETVRLLLEADVDPNCIFDKDHRTPLHLAVLCGEIEVIDMLLKFDANTDSENASGWTPLHFAVQMGCIAAVKIFVQNDADLNCANTDGDTPLHLAVAREQVDIVALLLKYNVNQNLENDSGDTPIDILLQDSSQLDIIIKISEKISTEETMPDNNIIDSDNPFGRLAQCSVFFRNLETMRQKIQLLNKGNQEIANNYYDNLYHFGKAWINGKDEEVLLFQKNINDLLKDFQNVPKKNLFNIFSKNTDLSAYKEFSHLFRETYNILSTIVTHATHPMLITPKNAR